MRVYTLLGMDTHNLRLDTRTIACIHTLKCLDTRIQKCGYTHSKVWIHTNRIVDTYTIACIHALNFWIHVHLRVYTHKNVWIHTK